MNAYQCGIRSDDLSPVEFDPASINPNDWRGYIVDSVRDKNVSAVVILLLLAVPLLVVFSLMWVGDKIANFMPKVRHRRIHNEENIQVSKK